MTITTSTDDVNELKSVLRDFLTATASSEHVRRTIETADGFDATLWGRMVNELGLPGLAVPEDYGGGGYDASVQLAVFEELGRSLACVPYLSTVGLAIPALLACAASPVRSELLHRLAAGEITAAVAHTATDGTPSGVTAKAENPDSDRAVLHGETSFVIDGASADVVLVAAHDGAELQLYVVDASSAGVSRKPMRVLDQTRPMAHIVFNATPARRISVGDAGAVLDVAVDEANAMIAAEQLGGAARCLDMAVEYAKIRQQFGRPIGSFQAVKHKCADMLVAVESARSAVDHLAAVLRYDPSALHTAAPLAKAFCSEAYTFVAGENIQVHGGIGFTWEHDAHLYFRRAHSTAILHGDSAFQRRTLADRLKF
ncbi:acyl-CoA dehydrogenase family protein [Mycobacterium kyogaense]|uniref:acyl-CoA dehydrogenase family protein n=1 Tax=Mycobacterium kyogaense TaxID=2212479 RepID=UPI000DAD90F9|nr:acyl-CoA dehydrogenase family protein [Mycobacterium kyogaense]